MPRREFMSRPAGPLPRVAALKAGAGRRPGNACTRQIGARTRSPKQIIAIYGIDRLDERRVQAGFQTVARPVPRRSGAAALRGPQRGRAARGRAIPGAGGQGLALPAFAPSVGGQLGATRVLGRAKSIAAATAGMATPAHFGLARGSAGLAAAVVMGRSLNGASCRALTASYAASPAVANAERECRFIATRMDRQSLPLSPCRGAQAKPAPASCA